MAMKRKNDRPRRIRPKNNSCKGLGCTMPRISRFSGK